MGKEKTNKIFLSTDDNYFIHLLVTVVSILENCSNNKRLEFFIFDGGIKNKNKKQLKEKVKSYGSRVSFLKVNKKNYSNAKLWEHVSESGYYRFEIPSIEKKSKVIYLDCDLVLNSDILEFFNLDLEEKTIGAVYDYLLKFTQQRNNFNSGVLIIDCEKWNKKNYSSKILNYLKDEGQKVTFADQEVFNHFFKKDWKSLPLEWNRQRSIYDLTAKEMSLSKKEYRFLLKNPRIIHYVGKIKPWDYKYVFPDKKEYQTIRKKVDPFFLFKKKNITSFLFKLVRFFLYKFKLIRFLNRKSV